MMPSMSDLPALPITTVPFPNETVTSFIDRLTVLNHLRRTALHRLVIGPANRAVDIDRLAALTGREVNRLQQALPELRSHGQQPSTSADFAAEPRWACRGGSAKRGITTAVRYWAGRHTYVCLRHRRWIGPAVPSPHDQLDLECLPEVLASAVAHRNLVRRRGPGPVAAAYERAVHVIRRWTADDQYGQHRVRRLAALASQSTSGADEPTLEAANYPETVALASILASPYWLGKAASTRPDDQQQFFTEIGHRLQLPYLAESLLDPIVHWTYRGGPHDQLELATTNTGGLP
jgi:hypothetical protein